MIQINGSHDYLRARLRTTLEQAYLTLNDAFRSLDTAERGFLSSYDLQDLLTEFRRSGSNPTELIQDVELLLNLYDMKKSARSISHWSFIEMLTP